MEMGSLAEWVTGLAETLAVVVALFLPIYKERKRRKRTQKKIDHMGYKLAKRVILDKQERGDQELSDLSSFKEFERFSSVISIIEDNEDILEYLQNIEDIVSDLEAGQTHSDQALKKLEEIKL